MVQSRKKIEQFSSLVDVNCDKDIENAFQSHKVKTDVIIKFKTIFDPTLIENKALFDDARIGVQNYLGDNYLSRIHEAY